MTNRLLFPLKIHNLAEIVLENLPPFTNVDSIVGNSDDSVDRFLICNPVLNIAFERKQFTRFRLSIPKVDKSPFKTMNLEIYEGDSLVSNEPVETLTEFQACALVCNILEEVVNNSVKSGKLLTSSLTIY